MTTCLCLDASVAAKWWLDEIHSTEARLLKDRRLRLIAPSLLPIELASLFTQKRRRGQLSVDALTAITGQLNQMPIRIAAADNLLALAVDLALTYHPSVYDCLYAALALREGCQVVTADRPFFDALKAGFPDTMAWIEDIQAMLA